MGCRLFGPTSTPTVLLFDLIHETLEFQAASLSLAKSQLRLVFKAHLFMPNLDRLFFSSSS